MLYMLIWQRVRSLKQHYKIAMEWIILKIEPDLSRLYFYL